MMQLTEPSRKFITGLPSRVADQSETAVRGGAGSLNYALCPCGVSGWS